MESRKINKSSILSLLHKIITQSLSHYQIIIKKNISNLNIYYAIQEIQPLFNPPKGIKNKLSNSNFIYYTNKNNIGYKTNLRTKHYHINSISFILQKILKIRLFVNTHPLFY